jgi:homoserine dehydrogenase
VSARPEVRVALFGAGRVGRAFLELLVRNQHRIRLTGVSDSHGGMAGELDPEVVLEIKLRRGELPSEVARTDLLTVAEPHVVVDATSCAFDSGEPSLSVIVDSFQAGAHVVTANKIPLARFWTQITNSATVSGRRLGYAAAAGAALPAIAVARWLGGADRVRSFEAVLTGVTTFTLELMAKGLSLENAIVRAQERGIAEPNPSMDIDGWDTAAKIVILANTLWETSSTLYDVRVTGLKTDTAPARGEFRTQLVGSGRRDAGSVNLEVAPTPLPRDHPLSHLEGGDKGVVFSGPMIGTVAVLGGRSHPSVTAAAMLADVLEMSTGADVEARP